MLIISQIFEDKPEDWMMMTLSILEMEMLRKANGPQLAVDKI